VIASEQTQADDRAAVVIVIDDDASVRAALEDLLGSVGLNARTFSSPQAFLDSDWMDSLGCIVLDIRMPGMSGLDFQRELAALQIRLPIIFISAHADVPMSVRAMKAGASDFLTKPFRDQDLLDAIHEALRNDRVRRRHAAVIDELQERYALLSLGERKVLAFVVAGMLNKQIAAALHVSEVTIKVRRASLMRKLRAASLAELVQIAAKLGVSRDDADVDGRVGHPTG
jgi:FixJ family two-component response regulator